MTKSAILSCILLFLLFSFLTFLLHTSLDLSSKTRYSLNMTLLPFNSYLFSLPPPKQEFNFLNLNHNMYDYLTKAILDNLDVGPNGEQGIRPRLTGTALKDFNDQLRRLWLNGVPGHTDPAIDPLLNSIIEAEIKSAHPGVVLVK